MSINFQCPFCGQKLEAAEDWVGNHAQCPSCQNDITIIQQQDQPNMNSKDMNDEEHTKNLRDDKTAEKKLQDGKEQITSQNIQNRETESPPINSSDPLQMEEEENGLGPFFTLIIIVVFLGYVFTEPFKDNYTLIRQVTEIFMQNFGLFWALFGALIGIAAAQRKGFSIAGGIIGGMLLGPLAFLMFLCSGGRKKCPFCAEWIQKEAILCPHCKKNL